MAILRMKEIQSMNSDERSKKIIELRAELMKLRTTARSKGSIENSDAPRQIRRTIARLLTVENEEKRGK